MVWHFTMFTADITLEQVKDSVFIVVITVHSNRMFLYYGISQ